MQNDLIKLLKLESFINLESVSVVNESHTN